MKIRKAKKEDLKEITRIYREEYSKKPYNEKWTGKTAIIRVKYLLKNSIIIIAEENKKIIGAISFFIFPWAIKLKGYVEDFIVDSKFQNKGVGSKLLERAEKEIKKKGGRDVWMEVHRKSRAFKFYKKRGYISTKYQTLEKKLK